MSHSPGHGGGGGGGGGSEPPPFAFAYAHQLGGIGSDFAKSITIDPTDGSYLVAGVFSGQVDFDPDPSGERFLDTGDPNVNAVFLAKYASTGQLHWATMTMRDWVAGSRWPIGLTTDGGGNVYLTTANVGYSVVAKFDAAGNLAWDASLSSYHILSTALDVDANGGVYVTGIFRGTADFDPGPGTFLLTSSFQGDVFVVKLDAAGNLDPTFGARSFSSPNTSSRSLDIVHHGNAVFITVDYNGNTTVRKLDATSGAEIWSRSPEREGPSGGSAFTYGLAVDSQGNVWITGDTAGTLDFDPDPKRTFELTTTSWDVFVWKLDNDGNFLWAGATSGGGDDDHGWDIAIDGGDNVYLAGYFSDRADLDPGPGRLWLGTRGGGGQAFVCKLDSGGDLIWAASLEVANPAPEGGLAVGDEGVAVDGAGNVYTVGSFLNTVDLDPTAGQHIRQSAGSFDGFVLKLTQPTGSLMATSTGNHPRAEPLTAAQVDPLLAVALARWESADADVSGLGDVQIVIADLPGATLGLASDDTIWLDANAAGWGWFVDPTPWEDSEFTTPGDQGEEGRIDLLSVLMHEMGHLLGQDHEADGLMAEALTAGTRLGPSSLDADALAAIFALLVNKDEDTL